MSFTVQSKSQLAKLLATENLAIEHQKIQTAMFDPKARVLYCPIWENMDGELYDLLMGHEVGHALYTPAEGWHDAVSTRGRKFKGFLNVVEDARIEKKIKRRYPGIRKSFTKGYQDIIARDFFGIKGRDVNTMSFVDRLNIHEKVGDEIDITFTDEEQKLVDEVNSCETWDDVLRVTGAVFEYSKNEQFETYQTMTMEYSFGDSDDFDFDDSDDYESGEPTSGEQNIGEKSDVDESSDNQSDPSGETAEGKDGEEDTERSNELNRVKDSHECMDDFEPTCSTDESFRANESKLVSSVCKPYVYLNVPTPFLNNIVTPYTRVHQLLEEFWFTTADGIMIDKEVATGNKKLQAFRSKNDRYIDLLAKEFEMRKAATAYNKSKLSSTGDIDINKVYKYQVEDNIFKKMMRVPKGKSHGLILLLDRSGSMEDNMAGSIEQILVLAMFCRKVNIPFVVYGFGNSFEGRRHDFPGTAHAQSFSQSPNQMRLNNVYLREYINSRMNNAEFTRCLRNMVRLMESYSVRYTRRPVSEHLSNTPLVEAMVALAPITNEFRKVNNLDLVNLVVVHDGDADTCREYLNKDCDRKYFDASKENVFFRLDKKTIQLTAESQHEAARKGIFDWYNAVTGAKIFGFFITGSGSQLRSSVINKYHNEDNETVYKIIQRQQPDTPHYRINYHRTDFVNDLISKIKKDKFIESFNPGYSSFYIMPGGDELNIKDEELVVNGPFTASKLKTAFLKINKKRQVNRVMVTRFISGIAA